MTAELQGVNDVDKALREIALRTDKLNSRALRSGANAVNRSIRRASPRAFRGIIKASVKRTSVDTYTARMGFANKEGLPKKGKVPPTWSKAYWLNYGTLANRDPSHHFGSPVRNLRGRAASARRGGIKPRNFFDKAIQGWETTLIKAYQNYMQKHLK